MFKFDLVCVPFHDYKVIAKEGSRTRDAHLYKHFLQHRNVDRVILLNRPTLALEIFLGKKKLYEPGKVIYNKLPIVITEIAKNSYTIDIIDFSFYKPVLQKKGFLPELYRKNTVHYRHALDVLSVKTFATYESSPLTVDLVSKLGAFFNIFDGVDNLCKHSTYIKHTENLKRLYFHAIESYDLILFNSNDTIKFFGVERHPRVFMVPNGVDCDNFRKTLPCPDALKKFKRPLIMYAGKMQCMFDTDLLRNLAKENPKCTFVLLGMILEGNIQKQLSDLNNVVFLGDIHYSLLPNFITNADVCIIPYKEEKQHGGDPIKFYEYLAANKPVVSTRIGEIEKYHNGTSIFIVPNEGFPAALRTALKLKVSSIAHPALQEVSWKYKAEGIIDKVRKRHDSQTCADYCSNH